MIEKLFLNNNFFLILSFLILVALSVMLSDILEKKIKNIHQEVLRKLPHILIGIIFTLSPIFLSQIEIIILSLLLVAGVIIARHFPFIQSVFSINRVSFGLILTPLSLGIMAFLWIPENIKSFIFGMLILTFSDSLAALAGRIYGKKRIPYSSKTYIGSFAFFISTLFIISFTSEKWAISSILIISIFLTMLEIILIFGFDNLFLPIVASFLFHFLM